MASNKRDRAGSNSQLSTSNTLGNIWNPVDTTSRPRLTTRPSDSVLSDKSASFQPSKPVQTNAEFRSTNRTKQLSMQSQKGPMGPRPLDDGKGTRSLTNDGCPAPSQIASPRKRLNSISRFSFESQISLDDEDNPYAQVNFDDFHSNITSTEPALGLPIPTVAAMSDNLRPDETSIIPRPTSSTAPLRKASVAESIGRTGALKRQQGTASTPTNSNNSDLLSMQAPPVTSTRRQSHFPPNSFKDKTAPRVRKSIGPGAFAVADPTEIGHPRRRPSRKSVDKEVLSGRPKYRRTGSGSGEPAKLAASGRGLKAKSFQPSMKGSMDGVLTSSQTSDTSQPPWANATGTLGKSSAPALSTDKRVSLMRVRGLGARTISPTDARRLKRLSMVPPMPVALKSQNSSEPPLRGQRSTPHSPALNARKSLTPTSSRTTPDPNRKSYSSGQSLSSSTSYNSVRNTAGPLSRLPQGVLSSSRLPTPKPRLDATDVDGTGEVPPVPAIPKAFESPQSELEQPFFSARSSSLPHVDTPISTSPTVEPPLDAFPVPETGKDAETSFHKSCKRADTELLSKPVPSVRKRPPPPILPPINVLPLSTPTAAKIMALQNVPSSEERPLTPPLGQTKNKTPSTPMTASRVNFSSWTYHDNQPSPARDLRSSTSHRAVYVDMNEFGASHGSSNNNGFSFGTGHRNISPLVSSSLPKCGGGFANFMQPKHGGEVNRQGAQARPTGSMVPSFSSKGKQEKLSPNDPESAFSASAIRRKLSLSRRRSTSKNRENGGNDGSAKYNGMPPPRLPASATWGNLAVTNHSPTQKQIYLNSHRKASASSFNTSQPNERDQTPEDDHSTQIEGCPSIESKWSFSIQSNRSSSVISSPPNLLSSSPVSQVRPQNVNLDKDDMMAEEEMRKLATKRKDVESAAWERDDLQRRAHPGDCASPLDALKTANLNIFERGEVMEYRAVYFTGTSGAKKIGGDLDASSNNFGYDDDRGDYNIVKGDHLAYRYEVTDLLGRGSFGQVVRCIDHKTGILVAVKIIRNKKRFHQQALVEVDILQKLREWDPDNQHSVVKYDRSFYFREHLCISTELLNMNLYEFIKANDHRGFSLKLIRRFTKQLLGCLVLLHSHKVIHCDLKPENVLLAHPTHSEIRVIDFGSSCLVNEQVYTYIQSRFYRSPEVILGMSYGMPIDMWSVGCILAELYTGYPIFPGENEQEQLACIMEVFGLPEKRLIEESTRKTVFFDSMGKPRLTVSSKGRRRWPSSKKLSQVLKCEDEAFLDFITRCFRWDPSRRLKPQEAMKHEFVTGMKPNAGQMQAAGTANTTVKRLSMTTVPSTSRPLPQLPPSRPRQIAAPSNSPSKPGPKRHSTSNGTQAPYTPKQASFYMPPMTSRSTLPKVIGHRSMSGRQDLATTAAATAAAAATVAASSKC